MEFQRVYNKGQATIFGNKYLEFFTRSHPLLICGIYIPVIIFMLYHSIEITGIGLFYTALIFKAGMIFWTFFEYLVHRFAFHFIPESKRAMKLIYIIHGNHHEYPRDKTRLLMPAIPSIIIASSIFGVMYFLASLVGVREFSFGFFSGFIFGYLLYGSMHYAIHAFNPPYKWMKPLWRNHHLHHYKDDRYGFGVSTTFWDRLFGTMPKSETEKLTTAKIRKMRF